jgi:hypothetical protein
MPTHPTAAAGDPPTAGKLVKAIDRLLQSFTAYRLRSKPTFEDFQDLAQLHKRVVTLALAAGFTEPPCMADAGLKIWGPAQEVYGQPFDNRNAGKEWEQKLRSLRAEAAAAAAAPTAPPAGADAGEEEPVTGAEHDAPLEMGEPSERQRSILRTMLEQEITSERRRKKQADIVRLINRTHKPASYTRDFAALVKRGFLQSLEGPTGGTWIVPKRKADVEQLVKDA